MLLQAIDIHKSYDGVRALNGVSLDLREGEVHALIGENGAGKSTFIKILTGALQPDSGRLLVRGRTIEHNTPAKARELGIAAIYQQPALFPDLTVAENIAIGNEAHQLWRKVDWTARRKHAAYLLQQIGAAISPDAVAESLSMPEQQLVEIAKALDANASIVIMDEPTASLGTRDADNLFRIIHDLRKKNTAILYISHRLEELPRIADRVTILRDGNTVDTKPMSGVTSSELIRLMVGRELDALTARPEIVPGDVVLDLIGFTSEALNVRDVSLSVRRGEILGLAGLVGSGRTQLAEAVFGLAGRTEGQVFIEGGAVEIRSPSDAVRAGLAYVPEDRRRHGVILEMPIATNVTLASLEQVSSHYMVSDSDEQRIAEDFRRTLQVKTPSINTPVRNLSGGNQQKVSLARWLMTKPKVLILDEPTQGIDVHAKAEIHRLIGELAQAGVAIILISSDMGEVLTLSNRIAVMARGRVVGTVEADEVSPDQVLAMALGHVGDVVETK